MSSCSKILPGESCEVQLLVSEHTLPAQTAQPRSDVCRLLLGSQRLPCARLEMLHSQRTDNYILQLLQLSEAFLWKWNSNVFFSLIIDHLNSSDDGAIILANRGRASQAIRCANLRSSQTPFALHSAWFVFGAFS